MLCCNVFPGAAAAAPCQPRLLYSRAQSSGPIPCSTRAISHLEQFTYRPQPSPLKAPSLRRGWTLSPNHGKPDSGLETLLSRPEQGREGDLPQVSQWRKSVEGEEYKYLVEGDGVSVKSTSNGRPSAGPVQDDRNKDGEDIKPILTKPKYVRGPGIDKKSFIRVYYISALRVPTAECWDLVFKLREHLLNWPRVNNVGRVLGDDVDEDQATVLVETPERKRTITRDEIRTAVYANSETESLGGGEQEVLRSREAATTLEVIEAAEDGSEPEDGTLAGPFLNLSKKWVGPTRLLLLDEKYAGEEIQELPEALQVEYSRLEHLASKSGLVNCRLTVFYEYWSMDEVLQELLPAEAQVPVTLDRAGHVAELRLHPEHLPFRHLIAQVTLDKCKPTVRSVVVKKDMLSDRQYAVQIELLAGTTSLVTTAWEHDIPYRIDMASVIWNPRLSSERQRLVNSFSENDVVCDLCAGVGPFAILASKKVRRVYANEVNPHAYFYLTRNVVENKASGKVEVFNEDIEAFLSKVFDIRRPLPITQLIMSHPLATHEFLEVLHGAFSRRTWPNVPLPWIHLYGISRDNDREESFSKEIAGVLGTTNCEISSRVVTEMACGEWMVLASFVLPSQFGFR